MANVQAIKCKKCGAPSYAEQARQGFLCLYCGDFVPWAIANAKFTSNIVFKHRSIPVVDGLLKLTHVGLPEREPDDLKYPTELSERVRNTDDKLSELDSKAFRVWKAREMITVACKFCGAQMMGKSTQNIFECEYCKNKIMDEQAFKDGIYRKEIFGYNDNIYNKAIPFVISKEEAKRRILRLAKDYPDDFGKQLTEKRIDNDLQAVYLPYRLEDVSLKATVETEKGKFTFYQERINWATPRSVLFDVYLIDALQPWDFGETAPFSPAYLEGDIQIFSPSNNEAVDLAMKRILWRDIPVITSAEFGLQNVKPLTWDYNFRRHSYAYFNLPVWFLDKRREDNKNDLQIRAAVNGQTGKAAAIFLQTGKKDYIRTQIIKPVPEMSDDCTIFSPPAPIIYIKSPFLYKIISLKDAVKKR